MKDITIDEEILDYVSKEVYQKTYYQLKNGENKILYEDKKIRISLIKTKKRVFAVKTHYGDMPIEEVVRNMMLIQAEG